MFHRMFDLMPCFTPHRQRALCLSVALSLSLFLVLVSSPAMAAATFDQQLTEANRFAQAEQYGKAVEIYNALRKSHPDDKLLQNNWKVLVVNYGVQLQGEEKYAEAETQFQNVLAVDPTDKHALQSLAGNYFHQGLKLRESGSADYAGMRALFQKASDTYPGQPVFLQAMGAIYFDEGIEVAKNGTSPDERANAIPLLEKAHQLNPANNDIVQSLVTLCLDLAKYENDTGKREDLLLRALTLDHSDGTLALVAKIREAHDTPPEVIDAQTASADDTTGRDDGMAGENNAGSTDNDDSALSKKERKALKARAKAQEKENSKENKDAEKKADDSEKPVEKKPPSVFGRLKGQSNQLPAAASTLSLQEMMMDIENQLGLPVNNKASLKDRLQTAETEALGEDEAKTRQGSKAPLTDRIRALYATVLGAPPAETATDTTPHTQTAFAQDSYLDEIFKVTSGYVIRWGRFPVRVYIDEPKNKLYRDGFRHSAEAGIRVWKLATYGDVTYTIVKNERAADIIVKWADDYVDRYADPEKVPDFYKSYSPPSKMTNNMMRVLQVASMFTPGLYAAAPQAIGAAVQYRQNKKLDALRDESVITLGLNPTAGLKDREALILVQNMMAKEFGHALGLKGQSPVEGDLMYPDLRADLLQTPSRRDIVTLNDLYNRTANILLNVN